MDIYLDDNKLTTELAPDATLLELVNETRQRLTEAGKILVAVQCDGLDVTGDGFGEALQRNLSTMQRIDFQTASPKALVIEAMDTASELLEASQLASTEIVNHLAQGDTAEALPKLRECCTAWSQVHEGICNSINMLGIAPDTIKVDDKPLAELLVKPCEQLAHIREVVESQDFVLLSDVLNYEFGEVVEIWQSIIDTIVDRVSESE